VLCEKLEEKMKGTTVESTIQKLFEVGQSKHRMMNTDSKQITPPHHPPH